VPGIPHRHSQVGYEPRGRASRRVTERHDRGPLMRCLMTRPRWCRASPAGNSGRSRRCSRARPTPRPPRLPTSPARPSTAGDTLPSPTRRRPTWWVNQPRGDSRGVADCRVGAGPGPADQHLLSRQRTRCAIRREVLHVLRGQATQVGFGQLYDPGRPNLPRLSSAVVSESFGNRALIGAVASR
jgi:hypothetical protein